MRIISIISRSESFSIQSFWKKVGSFKAQAVHIRLAWSPALLERFFQKLLFIFVKNCLFCPRNLAVQTHHRTREKEIKFPITEFVLDIHECLQSLGIETFLQALDEVNLECFSSRSLFLHHFFLSPHKRKQNGTTQHHSLNTFIGLRINVKILITRSSGFSINLVD